MNDIDFLLKYGSEGGEDFAKLYNKIANVLYTDFGISGASLAMMITYFVDQYKKGALKC